MWRKMRFAAAVVDLVAVAGVALLSLPPSALTQDRATMLTALRELENAMHAKPGKFFSHDLVDLAEWYVKLDQIPDASRLFNEVTSRISQEPDDANRKQLLVTLAASYVKLGDYAAARRLEPLDPTSPWARDLATTPGNSTALFERLSAPSLTAQSASDAIDLYVSDAIQREGQVGGRKAVAEIRAFMLPPPSATLQPYSAARASTERALSEGWDLAIREWLPKLIVDAHQTNRLDDVLDWAWQLFPQKEIESAIASAISGREHAGDETLFERLENDIRERQIKLGLLGEAATERVKHGRIESAVKLAKLVVDSRDHMDEGTEVNGYLPTISHCHGPTKPRLALDRDHFFVASGFVDCGSDDRRTTLTLELGAVLAEAKQYDLARAVLNYSLSLGRRPSSGPCPPSYESLKEAQAYHDVGATELVGEYIDLFVHTCTPNTTNAFFVANLLTLLRSPDGVPPLIESRRFQDRETAVLLSLGLISGLVERGMAEPLRAALRSAPDKRRALYALHGTVQEMSDEGRRLEPAIALKVALDEYRSEYLTADEDQQHPCSLPHHRNLLSPQWMVDYVEAGLGPAVTGLIGELANRTVTSLNAQTTRCLGPGQQHVYLELVAPEILGYATLFLAARKIDPGAEVAQWAAKINDEFFRRYFNAFACEALVLTGDLENAKRLAATLSTFGPAEDLGDFRGPRLYATLGLRPVPDPTATPAETYTFLLESGGTADIQRLLYRYEARVEARQHR
jgi:hypothetical protein